MTAVTAIPAAAIRISEPSTPAEKYSALAWPYAWSSSAGLTAQRSAAIATTTATRLTTDSAASESRPTDPVSAQAPSLSVIVATAAASESHSRRKSRRCSIPNG